MPLTLKDIIQNQEMYEELKAKLVSEIRAELQQDIDTVDLSLLTKIVRGMLSEMKGEKGDSYVLTDEDKKAIASTITVPVVEKVIEKTEVIREKPIETIKVTNEIKEVAVSDTAEEIREKLASLEGEDRLDASHIKNLPKRGIVNLGGGSRVYHRVIYPSQIVGAIDGSNVTFHLPEAPKRVEELELMVDNTIQEPAQNFTLAGNRVDFTFAPQVGQRIWGRIFRT